MNNIYTATSEAIKLLVTGDVILWQVIGTTLIIAFIALLFAMPIAIFSAYQLAVKEFMGRKVILLIIHALLAMPTVVVGLILFILLSKSGPLGTLELLFTPTAVAIGQFIIALPILLSFCYTSMQSNAKVVKETARNFGANYLQAFTWVLYEHRKGLTSALLVGFGRVVSEVGCALLVGGNIAGYTRTIPTAIALDTGKGMFVEGIALGIVLLLLSVITSLLFLFVNTKKKK